MTRAPTVLLSMALLLAACDGASPLDADVDPDDGGIDAASTPCARNADCDDSIFCNGAEECAPDSAGADARGCRAGTTPCGSVARCSEATGTCVCEGESDVDGDGHDSLACGGDDCDDENGSVFPGAAEACDAAGLDEDCDPATLASDVDGDLDRDGHISVDCCNGLVCGTDCDDARAAVSPEAEEACNVRDDDCDGDVDEPGAFCPVGMCMGNRCRSVPWERVFAGADDLPQFGLEAGPDGTVFIGLNMETYYDIDGDGTDEPFGAYLLAFEPDGRMRFMFPLTASGVGLAATPDGATVVVASSDSLSFHSTADGAMRAEVAVEVSGASFLRVAHFDSTQSGLVAAVEWGTGVGSSEYELVSFDVEGAPRARRRLADPRSFYDLRGFEAAGGFVGIIGAADGELDLGDVVVPTYHLIVLDEVLEVVWSAESVGTARTLGVGSDGSAAIAGTYTTDFSPPWTTTTWSASADADAFVAVFDPSGAHSYTRVHAGLGTVTHAALAFDGRGSLFETGSFTGELRLPPRGSLGPTSDSDAFYAQLDASEDFTLSIQGMGGTGLQRVEDVVVDPFGGLLVIGRFGSGIVLPTGTFYEAPYRSSVFLVRVADF